MPPSRTLWLANAFAQDTIALTTSLDLVLGIKLEDNPFAGVTPLPNVRLAWKPLPDLLLWGAVSRAIRSSTPFENDVVETLGNVLFLQGSPAFRSEKLTAFEGGTRFQPDPDFAVSVSAFYNAYDDLRSIEPAPGGFIPLRWGNGLQGYSYGIDSWADWQVRPWWKLSASFSFLRGRFEFQKGASGFAGLSQLGSDPRHRATMGSAMDLGNGVTLDGMVRHVGPSSARRLSGTRRASGMDCERPADAVDRGREPAPQAASGISGIDGQPYPATGDGGAAMAALIRMAGGIALMCLATATAQGAGANLEYAVKGNFLYKFAPFVSWPPQAFAASTPLRICVAGADPFGGTLDAAVRGQRVGGRTIVVTRIRGADGLGNCHILYLGASPSPTAEMLRSVAGQPVLTVTDERQKVSAG
ncbi:MAG TPA: TonB-dependent receptor [Sphingomonas sp.]